MTSDHKTLEVISVQDATERGWDSILDTVASGIDVAVEKDGAPMAVIVSIEHMYSIIERGRDLQSLALVTSRLATDNGNRTSLDDLILSCGLDPASLRQEAAAEFAKDDSTHQASL